MPSVFDDIARDLAGPHQAGEPQFSYLNRSSRPEAGRVRELIEAWVAAYPEGDRTRTHKNPAEAAHFLIRSQEEQLVEQKSKKVT